MRSFVLWHHLFMTSTINVPKKSRGRPAVESDRIVLRIQEPDLGAIDAFAAETKGLSRQDAIRRILKDWLTGHGYLKD